MNREAGRSTEITVPQTPGWIEDVSTQAKMNMQKYDSCSQSILAAFMEVFEIDNPQLLSSAGAMLGGMASSLTCGVHTSSMMVLGLLMGREDLEHGVDGLVPIIRPAQQLIERLNTTLGSHSCLEITGVDFTDRNQARRFHISDERERCIVRVGAGAEELARFISELDKREELFRPQLKKS